MKPIAHGQYSKKTLDTDSLHRAEMAKRGKYKHLTPEDPEFNSIAAEIMARHAEKEEEKATMAPVRKIRPCAKCGRTMTILNRGLCTTCWRAETAAGTLDANYPPLTKGRPLKKPMPETVPATVAGLLASSPTSAPAVGASCPRPDQPQEQPVSEYDEIIKKNNSAAMADAAKQPFEHQLDNVLGNLRAMLLSKNQAYGNSALEPVRIFSHATTFHTLGN